MQTNLTQLQAHLSAVLPLLSANLSAAYTEWTNGDLPRGAYEYCRARHATALALIHATSLDVPVDAAFAAGAPLFLDLRTALKDVPENERPSARAGVDALHALYRAQGFTDTCNVLRVPCKPAATHTVPDCTLEGKPVALADWGTLGSDALARIVGRQEPGAALESASDYTWKVAMLPVAALELATEDGDAPKGGWLAAYQRHCEQDARAVADGSPEYAGRAAWLQDAWAKDTRIYPLFVVEDEPGVYRLWDGYHRLAGAFALKLEEVCVLLGKPKTAAALG